MWYYELSHSPSLFCDRNLCPSPLKTWNIPTYTNDFAKQLAQGSYRIFRTKDSSRYLHFVDDGALESDREASSHEENSNS